MCRSVLVRAWAWHEFTLLLLAHGRIDRCLGGGDGKHHIIQQHDFGKILTLPEFAKLIAHAFRLVELTKNLLCIKQSSFLTPIQLSCSDSRCHSNRNLSSKSRSDRYDCQKL